MARPPRREPRRLLPPRASAVSPQFNDLNLNKLSLAADLAASDGAALLRRLVSVSDVLTASYRPGVLERLGFDYASLRRVRPDIIVATVSSAGADRPREPLRRLRQHLLGAGRTRHAHRLPRRCPARPWATASISALRRAGLRRPGGALRAAQDGSRPARRHLGARGGEQRPRRAGRRLLDEWTRHRALGQRLDDALVHDLYRCAGDDAWVSIAVFEDADFAALCGAIGRADLRGGPAGAEVDAAISAWTSARPPEEAARLLQEAGVAAMPYRSARPRRRRPPPGCQGRLRRRTAGGLG